MSGWTVVAISVVGGIALDLLWPTNPLARLGAALYDRTLGRRWRSHSEKPRSDKSEATERAAERVDPNAGCGDRPCGRCGLFVVDGQPDPCWGRLPGVHTACCGHDFGIPYIHFTNGVTVSFESGAVQVENAATVCSASPSSQQEDALTNKYAWLVPEATWNRLHYVAGESVDTWAQWWTDYPDQGRKRTAACGVTFLATLPGWFSRMGAPRCAHCCDRLGITRGHGACPNDDTATAIPDSVKETQQP